MTDVVSRLWGFAHPLRHDGVDYGDFIEQITYGARVVLEFSNGGR